MAGFWDDAEIISAYSRADALADGVLFDLRQKPSADNPNANDLDALATEAGIKFPAAMTSTLFLEWFVPSAQDITHGQSVVGRLWDLWNVFRFEAKRGGARDSFIMPLRVWRGGRVRVVQIKAHCGPGDNAEPVLTFMLPDED